MLLNKQYQYGLMIFVLTIVSFSSLAQQLRDPTLPSQVVLAATTQTNVQPLVLNSVVHGQQSFAVINNKILSVGDTIQGVRVASIGKGYVTMSDGKKLTLFKSITER